MGRSPVSMALGLEKIGISPAKSGHIPTNANQQTSLSLTFMQREIVPDLMKLFILPSSNGETAVKHMHLAKKFLR